MKKLSVFIVLVAVVALLAACSKESNTSSAATPSPLQSKGDVAATVNGTPITIEELDATLKNQLARVQTQIYQIRKQGLDDIVENKLIEEAAKKKGKSVEEFTKEEIDTKAQEPTEQEVRSLYEARKGKETLPFEKVKDQLIAFLKQNRRNQAQQALVASLKKDADVKVMLDVPRVKVEVADAPAIGPKDAKVTLIEFSDYQCPFCKRVRPTIWQLVDQYKDKMRYVFMDFPLSFHQFSRKAHEAAHCAGDQGKYFEYNRKIFDSQTNLSVDDLKKYAKDLMLNTTRFNKCLDSGAHAKNVDKSIALGSSVGVTGTPSFFIDGIQLSGAQPIDAFKTIIDDELKK